MMKALIADDEYHVIQAIRLLVPWEELGISKVLTASCGQEAIALIEAENPELVITDIVMEDKSGLEIMDFVAGYSPASKVIAVSGHNDFEYVRAMLTKGCLDYLLKPLETDTLVATVKKAVEAYEEERRLAQGRQRLQEKVLSLSAFYSGVLLYKMLNPKTADGAYTELLEEAPGFSAVTSCRLLYYHTRYFPMDDPDFSQRMKRWDTGLSQRFSSKGLILANPDNGEEVLLFIPDLADSVAAGVIKGAQALFAGQPAFHIGASGWLPFPEEFSQAYEQAREAFMSRYGDIPSGGSIITPPPFPRPKDPQGTDSLCSLFPRKICGLRRTAFSPPSLPATKTAFRNVPQNGLTCFCPQGRSPWAGYTSRWSASATAWSDGWRSFKKNHRDLSTIPARLPWITAVSRTAAFCSPGKRQRSGSRTFSLASAPLPQKAAPEPT